MAYETVQVLVLAQTVLKHFLKGCCWNKRNPGCVGSVAILVALSTEQGLPLIKLAESIIG